MSSSPFSSINTIVVRPASASASQEKPSNHNHNNTLKTCSSLSFLGSTHKLRSSPITSSIRRQFSSSIVAVSNVINKNKSKSETSSISSSNLLITKEEGLELYEDMVLGRAFEDKCAQMHYMGKMFVFVHLYNGQEVVFTDFIKLSQFEMIQFGHVFSGLKMMKRREKDVFSGLKMNKRREKEKEKKHKV